MESQAEKLEYLTVQSIKWAKGYQRPCMSTEERRAKHRAIQQRFMRRKQERISELRVLMRKYTIQLMIIQAAQEATRLTQENGEIQDMLRESTEEMTPHDGDLSEEIDEDMLELVFKLPIESWDWVESISASSQVS